LGLDRVPATRLLNALIARGFVERDPSEEDVWRISDDAVKLANATAAPPMTRAMADAVLADIVDRARTLNEPESEFAFGVAQLIVFGSYLTDVPTLNDLDIAVEYRPRFADREAQYQYCRSRLAAAEERGYDISFLRGLFYANDEVARFLRGRLSRVSLLDFAERRDFVLGVPHQVVYTASESMRVIQPLVPARSPKHLQHLKRTGKI
jgi:hypothetical protein